MDAERDFGNGPDAAREARRFALQTLEEWSVADYDVVLVVDELATNAYCHARTPFRVRLILGDDRTVTVEVTDSGPGLPRLAERSESPSGGMGLRIVARLASDWGWRPAPGPGKTVWAVIPAPVR